MVALDWGGTTPKHVHYRCVVIWIEEEYMSTIWHHWTLWVMDGDYSHIHRQTAAQMREVSGLCGEYYHTNAYYRLQVTQWEYNSLLSSAKMTVLKRMLGAGGYHFVAHVRDIRDDGRAEFYGVGCVLAD